MSDWSQVLFIDDADDEGGNEPGDGIEEEELDDPDEDMEVDDLLAEHAADVRPSFPSFLFTSHVKCRSNGLEVYFRLLDGQKIATREIVGPPLSFSPSVVLTVPVFR